MSILLTCTVAAGLLFTPPDGYMIEKIAGPPKKVVVGMREGAMDDGSITLSNTITFGCNESKGEAVYIHLRQTGKTKETFELPKGCTGEATSVKFKSEK